jgi:DNA-binding GntR family transcriptional regulator
MNHKGLDDIQKRFKKEMPITLSKYVSDILTDAIVEGKMKVGQKLVEASIQEKLGISRSPIREAFRILEKNGLVVNIHRKGAYVRNVSEKDFRDNLPIRAYLEGLAARLAVPNLSLNNVARMETDLEQIIKTAKSHDYKTYHKHHSSFHETIITASDNATLIEFIESLRRQTLLFRINLSYFGIIHSPERAIELHSRILELVKKKDVEGVDVLVREHILLLLDGYLVKRKSCPI